MPVKSKILIISGIIFVICLAFIIYYGFFRGELYLWELEVNGKPVYFLGSIHVFKPELYPLIDPKILDAFNSSDLVLFENISYKYIPRRYWLEDGETLKDYIPEPCYSKVSDVLRINGYDIDEYSLYRPFDFLSFIYNLTAEMHGFSYYFNHGIDFYFMKLCVSRKIRTGNLEPAFYNNDLLEKHVKQDLAGFYISKVVRLYFEEGRTLGAEIEAGISDWLNGREFQPFLDFNQVFESDDDSEMKEKLLKAFKDVKYLRDLAMAESIERYSLSKSNKAIFAIAGCSHLAGENNVIEILEKKGYRAKRIKKSLRFPF